MKNINTRSELVNARILLRAPAWLESIRKTVVIRLSNEPLRWQFNMLKNQHTFVYTYVHKLMCGITHSSDKLNIFSLVSIVSGVNYSCCGAIKASLTEQESVNILSSFADVHRGTRE